MLNTVQFRKVRLLLALAAFSMALQGCLVIPHKLDGPGKGSRTNITKKQVEAFEPGKTTLEEVVLTFGEPEKITADSREITYQWSKRRWGFMWVWLAPGGGDAGRKEYGDNHQLVLTFDENYRLVAYRKTKDDNYKRSR